MVVKAIVASFIASSFDSGISSSYFRVDKLGQNGHQGRLRLASRSCGRSWFCAFQHLPDFLPLLANPIGEGAVWSCRQVSVQVIEQSAIILRVHVYIGEEQPKIGILRLHSHSSLGWCSGVGIAMETNQRASK